MDMNKEYHVYCKLMVHATYTTLDISLPEYEYIQQNYITLIPRQPRLHDSLLRDNSLFNIANKAQPDTCTNNIKSTAV